MLDTGLDDPDSDTKLLVAQLDSGSVSLSEAWFAHREFLRSEAITPASSRPGGARRAEPHTSDKSSGDPPNDHTESFGICEIKNAAVISKSKPAPPLRTTHLATEPMQMHMTEATTTNEYLLLLTSWRSTCFSIAAVREVALSLHLLSPVTNHRCMSQLVLLVVPSMD